MPFKSIHFFPTFDKLYNPVKIRDLCLCSNSSLWTFLTQSMLVPLRCSLSFRNKNIYKGLNLDFIEDVKPLEVSEFKLWHWWYFKCFRILHAVRIWILVNFFCFQIWKNNLELPYLSYTYIYIYVYLCVCMCVKKFRLKWKDGIPYKQKTLILTGLSNLLNVGNNCIN